MMSLIRKTILILLALLFCSQFGLADNLGVGDRVPDFTLTNHHGEKTSLSGFKGKGVVLSFLYTQCPYPTKCKMIGKKLAALDEVSAKLGDDKIQVLAITIDPKNDTPEVLKEYAQGFDKSHENWLFLTGSENDVAKIAGAFGVIYWDENGVIEHNMKTVFIDPEGTVQLIKSGSDWRAGEFAAQIKDIIDNE